MILQIGQHGVAFNRYQIFFFGAPARWKLCGWIARFWIPKKYRKLCIGEFLTSAGRIPSLTAEERAAKFFFGHDPRS